MLVRHSFVALGQGSNGQHGAGNWLLPIMRIRASMPREPSWGPPANSCYFPSWVDTVPPGSRCRFLPFWMFQCGPSRLEQPLAEQKTQATGRKRWVYRNPALPSTTQTISDPKTELLMIPGLISKFDILEGSIGKGSIDWNKARLPSP